MRISMNKKTKTQALCLMVLVAAIASPITLGEMLRGVNDPSGLPVPATVVMNYHQSSDPSGPFSWDVSETVAFFLSGPTATTETALYVSLAATTRSGVFGAYGCQADVTKSQAENIEDCTTGKLPFVYYHVNVAPNHDATIKVTTGATPYVVMLLACEGRVDRDTPKCEAQAQVTWTDWPTTSYGPDQLSTGTVSNMSTQPSAISPAVGAALGATSSAITVIPNFEIASYPEAVEVNPLPPLPHSDNPPDALVSAVRMSPATKLAPYAKLDIDFVTTNQQGDSEMIVQVNFYSTLDGYQETDTLCSMELKQMGSFTCKLDMSMVVDNQVYMYVEVDPHSPPERNIYLSIAQSVWSE